jgi:hypothetical protein
MLSGLHDEITIPAGAPRDAYTTLLAGLLRLPPDATDAQLQAAAQKLGATLQRAGWQSPEQQARVAATPLDSPWAEVLAQLAGCSTSRSPFLHSSLEALINALQAMGYFDEPQDSGDAITMLTADIPGLTNLAAIRHGLSESETAISRMLGITPGAWRAANPREGGDLSFAEVNLRLLAADTERVGEPEQAPSTLSTPTLNADGLTEMEARVARQLGISAADYRKYDY